MDDIPLLDAIACHHEPELIQTIFAREGISKPIERLKIWHMENKKGEEIKS